jgi:hypothetical protein
MSSNQSPRSKIRRTLEKEREELTVARRRRGSGGSGNHDEVLPVFPGGDGVHDGVPLEPAKTVLHRKNSYKFSVYFLDLRFLVHMPQVISKLLLVEHFLI